MVLLAKFEQIREKIKAKQNPQGFLFFSLAPSHLSIMIGYHSDVFVKIYTNKVKKIWKDSQMRKEVCLVSCVSAKPSWGLATGLAQVAVLDKCG